MNYLKRKETKAILFIFFLALFVRVLAAFLLGGFTDPEAWEYEDIARNLVHGKGMVINFIGEDYYGYSTPLYPAFAAFIYKVFSPDTSAVIIGQIIISSLLCILIYLIALKAFNHKIAYFSVLLCALHPGLIIYSSLKLHALSLDAFFISLVIFSFILLLEKPGIKYALFAGASYGLCMLTRSTIVLFFIIGLGLVIYFNRNQLKKALVCSLLVIIVSGLFIGSWSYRNYLIYERFIPLTTVSAEVFWRGNNVNATGSSFIENGEKILRADNEFYEKLKALNELERYDLFKAEAMNFIYHNPIKAAGLVIKKFYYFWWFSPASGKFYPTNIFRVYKYFYFLLLALALPGLINFRQGNNARVLIISALLAISLTQSLFYIEGRHRLAVESLLAIFAAATIFRIGKNEDTVFDTN